MSTYPTTVDSFTPDPTPTSKRNNPSLAGKVTDLSSAVVAVETFVGPSGAVAGPTTIVGRVKTLEAAGTPAVSNDICENLGGVAFNTFNRKLPATNTAFTAGNGLLLVAVTAPISITASKIKVYLTTGGSAGPTVSQLGLYSLNSSGDGTLIASTSSTAVFTGTGLISTNLTVPVGVTAGSRYAVGYIQSNGTGPTFLGLANGGSSQGALASLNPWVFALRGTGGTSPVPASFLYASLSAPVGYPEFYAEIAV